MPSFPDKKYSVIYADPPWDYRQFSKKWAQEHPESRWVGRKYDLMPLDEIKALPVKDITEPSAVLFMWTISTMIPFALEVIKEWGFTYKTVAFVWVKKNKKADSLFTGMGFWTRSNAEICLLATRGKIVKRQSKSVRQIILTARQEHSRKPTEARERIVELLGDQNRIELFSRERVDGWDGWGTEYPED